MYVRRKKEKKNHQRLEQVPVESKQGEPAGERTPKRDGRAATLKAFDPPITFQLSFVYLSTVNRRAPTSSSSTSYQPSKTTHTESLGPSGGGGGGGDTLCEFLSKHLHRAFPPLWAMAQKCELHFARATLYNIISSGEVRLCNAYPPPLLPHIAGWMFACMASRVHAIEANYTSQQSLLSAERAHEEVNLFVFFFLCSAWNFTWEHGGKKDSREVYTNLYVVKCAASTRSESFGVSTGQYVIIIAFLPVTSFTR